MKFEDIIYEKKDGVAKITLNRPEKRNALRSKTLQEIYSALIDARVDRSIGVIVITGAGDKAFCSGGQVTAEGESPELRGWAIAVAREIAYNPKPVIAMVNGYAIGGGNWLAYICDLTIASENAIFAQTGPKVGSPPTAWFVGYLAQVVGQKKARELWYLCHQYTAQEALEMGLVNKVVPLEKLQEEVYKWCQELLAMSPTSLKLAKGSFVLGTTSVSHNADVLEQLAGTDYLISDESLEGMRAFLEKRKPDFNKFRR